jgi:hypothetical protein
VRTALGQCPAISVADVQASRLKAAAPFQLAVINLRPPRTILGGFFIAVEKQMQSKDNSGLPSIAVPSGIALVFESREWLEFTKQTKPVRGEDRPARASVRICHFSE